MEFSEEQKSYLNKGFWIITVFLLGSWFYNESVNTKIAIRDESSLIFSNLMEQFKNLTSTTDSNLDLAKSNAEANTKLQEVAERLKTESARLSKDFSGNAYSKFGTLIGAAYSLSKGGQDQISNLESIASESGIEFADKPLDFVEKEIAILLKGRSLVSSNESVKIKEGQDLLINFALESKFLASEALLTYLMSLNLRELDTQEVTEAAYRPVKEVITKRPEIKESFLSELSRFGINLGISKDVTS